MDETLDIRSSFFCITKEKRPTRLTETLIDNPQKNLLLWNKPVPGNMFKSAVLRFCTRFRRGVAQVDRHFKINNFFSGIRFFFAHYLKAKFPPLVTYLWREFPSNKFYQLHYVSYCEKRYCESTMKYGTVKTGTVKAGTVKTAQYGC